mgnify:CR=1 FL=1
MRTVLAEKALQDRLEREGAEKAAARAREDRRARAIDAAGVAAGLKRAARVKARLDYQHRLDREAAAVPVAPLPIHEVETIPEVEVPVLVDETPRTVWSLLRYPSMVLTQSRRYEGFSRACR